MRTVFCDRCRYAIVESEGIAFVRITATIPQPGESSGHVREYRNDLCRPCFLDYRDWLKCRPWEGNPDWAQPDGSPDTRPPWGPIPSDRLDGVPTEGA